MDPPLLLLLNCVPSQQEAAKIRQLRPLSLKAAGSSPLFGHIGARWDDRQLGSPVPGEIVLYTCNPLALRDS